MNSLQIPGRRRALATLIALCATAGFAGACTSATPRMANGLAQLDVYDRVDGSALATYEHEGKRYIVGTPGHEYAVRIRNTTGERILVVTSVDGVNVVSGETASPAQSGYVLDPWGSVEIAGWRKSRERIAAFYFTEHANSYAARTGRPDDVGVIGVAVFREKVVPVERPSPRRYGALSGLGGSTAGNSSAVPLMAQPRAEAARGDAPAQTSAAPPSAADAAGEATMANKQMGKLGTGHGRSETSRVDYVRFDRASDSPSEMLAVNYDRRENLAAMGVLPPPQLARRGPNPFPGDPRFAPDPPR